MSIADLLAGTAVVAVALAVCRAADWHVWVAATAAWWASLQVHGLLFQGFWPRWMAVVEATSAFAFGIVFAHITTGLADALMYAATRSRSDLQRMKILAAIGGLTAFVWTHWDIRRSHRQYAQTGRGIGAALLRIGRRLSQGLGAPLPQRPLGIADLLAMTAEIAVLLAACRATGWDVLTLGLAILYGQFLLHATIFLREWPWRLRTGESLLASGYCLGTAFAGCTAGLLNLALLTFLQEFAPGLSRGIERMIAVAWGSLILSSFVGWHLWLRVRYINYQRHIAELAATAHPNCDNAEPVLPRAGP